MEKKVHEPVMLPEVIEGLHIKTDGKYIDGTLGAGGHTIQILKNGGQVLGIDADESMIEIAIANIHTACPDLEENFQVVNGNFKDIKKIAEELHFSPVDGVLLDLGISSKHLDDDQRGFSFKDPNAPLDMRLDTKAQSVTAAQLLNALRHDQLNAMFELGMTPPEARKWANRVTRSREQKPFGTVADMLAIAPAKTTGIHPATKAFMALRIAVNTEYENLTLGLQGAFDILKPEGRLVVIAFHSGEDRIVKSYFKEKVAGGEAETPGDQPLIPSVTEVESNPRSRSAKVRILIKNEIHKLSQTRSSQSSSNGSNDPHSV